MDCGYFLNLEQYWCYFAQWSEKNFGKWCSYKWTYNFLKSLWNNIQSTYFLFLLFFCKYLNGFKIIKQGGKLNVDIFLLKFIINNKYFTNSFVFFFFFFNWNFDQNILENSTDHTTEWVNENCEPSHSTKYVLPSALQSGQVYSFHAIHVQLCTELAPQFSHRNQRQHMFKGTQLFRLWTKPHYKYISTLLYLTLIMHTKFHCNLSKRMNVVFPRILSDTTQTTNSINVVCRDIKKNLKGQNMKTDTRLLQPPPKQRKTNRIQEKLCKTIVNNVSVKHHASATGQKVTVTSWSVLMPAERAWSKVYVYR